MTLSPQESFESFLTHLIHDEWVASFEWNHADSHSLLKAKSRKLPLGWSRSHKSISSGMSWSIDVEPSPGGVLGVDLELVVDRPILQNPKWLADRFGLSLESSTPQMLLEEWVCREAVFKACAPNNSELMLSSFCKTGPMSYGLVKHGQDASQIMVETRVCLSPDWIMAVARRKL